MGFWEEIGKGTVGALLNGAGQLAKDLRVAITGQTPLDPTKQAEIMAQLQTLEAMAAQKAIEYDSMQIQGAVDIAKIEAASSDKYSSRWRPTVGWVCCAGLAYEFLVRTILPWAVEVGAIITGHQSVIPALPEIPMEDLIILLTGLLGLSTARTYERVKGVTK